jgi:DnaJ-class molecular chaperone
LIFRFSSFPATLSQKSFYKKGKLTMSLNRAEALKTLAVEEKVTQEEVRAAYKKLALAVHPDKNPVI